MIIKDLQEKILKLKKEKDVTILAHCYQAKEILEVADFTGDSYKLSLDAKNAKTANILMCGVRFMAETAKILSPQKRVFLSNEIATCPMAEQMDPELISQLKAKEPDRIVVAYINTTAELKAVCDVCVTSATAVKIVEQLPNDKILFIPDCNLGDYVKKQVKGKDIKLLQGGCPVHACVTKTDALKAKEMHPDALLLVHPECRPDVVDMADYVGSTTGIMKFAKQSDKKKFIIGTEISISQTLQYECPDKDFYILSKKIICPNMKATTLVDVYNAINGIDNGKACEIIMTPEEIAVSRKCIDEMVRLGG